MRDKSIDSVQARSILKDLDECVSRFESKAGNRRENLDFIKSVREKVKKAMLHDVIIASTVAVNSLSKEDCIIVGVTAHCQCGNSFSTDLTTLYRP